MSDEEMLIRKMIDELAERGLRVVGTDRHGYPIYDIPGLGEFRWVRTASNGYPIYQITDVGMAERKENELH